MSDAHVDAIVHSQNNARRVGEAQVAVEVFGWTLKHARSIPAPAMKELLDIVMPKEPE